jgi:hypothetical protein
LVWSIIIYSHKRQPGRDNKYTAVTERVSRVGSFSTGYTARDIQRVTTDARSISETNRGTRLVSGNGAQPVPLCGWFDLSRYLSFRTVGNQLRLRLASRSVPPPPPKTRMCRELNASVGRLSRTEGTEPSSEGTERSEGVRTIQGGRQKIGSTSEAAPGAPIGLLDV